MSISENSIHYCSNASGTKNFSVAGNSSDTAHFN